MPSRQDLPPTLPLPAKLHLLPCVHPNPCSRDAWIVGAKTQSVMSMMAKCAPTSAQRIVKSMNKFTGKGKNVSVSLH